MEPELQITVTIPYILGVYTHWDDSENEHRSGCGFIFLSLDSPFWAPRAAGTPRQSGGERGHPAASRLHWEAPLSFRAPLTTEQGLGSRSPDTSLLPPWPLAAWQGLVSLTRLSCGSVPSVTSISGNFTSLQGLGELVESISLLWAGASSWPGPVRAAALPAWCWDIGGLSHNSSRCCFKCTCCRGAHPTMILAGITSK